MHCNIFTKISKIALIALCAGFASCSDDKDEPDKPTIDPAMTPQGAFVICEGNYNYGNASLSFINSDYTTSANNIFSEANGFKLGDVAQSMTIHGAQGWIVVNNSNVIFAVNRDTMKEQGRITEGIVQPRYIHFVSDSKAYVTQMYSNQIAIVDPKAYSVTGYITVPDMEASTGSTEMMEQVGDYVYVNCWSLQNRVIRIDTRTDKVDASVEVGVQPKSMVKDKDDNLWVLTDGGYYGNPGGYEAPRLAKITTKDFKVALDLRMPLDSYTPSLAINGAGDQLYWVCNDIYTMPISSTTLPASALIPSNGNYYYGLGVSPFDGSILLADAIDYVQPGRVIVYSPQGVQTHEFTVGVCPKTFCWSTK